MFRQRSGLIGAGVLTLWLVAAAWASPSQEDIDFCNRQAAEVSARTSKGAHETSPPPATAQSSERAADGMASIGERDGIYRFAYAVCLHQRGQ